MDWADRIGRRIRLRDLHIVLAVAECGSMSKASERMAISDPVVSKTISDLEHSLGVRLFDRNSKGVELTAYGRALLDCGNVVFDEMRQGLKQIEFLAHPDSGDLRIGSFHFGRIGVPRLAISPKVICSLLLRCTLVESGTKRTSAAKPLMSAFDPSRQVGLLDCCCAQ